MAASARRAGILTGQAMQNGTFVLFANGVGYDDGQVRTGNASIIHCNGEVLATTSEPKDLMVVADLNLKDLETAQGTRWKQARRPELYGKLTEPTGEEKNMREVRFGKT